MEPDDNTGATEASTTGTGEAANEREAPRFTRKDLDRAVGEVWARIRREHKAARDAVQIDELDGILTEIPEWADSSPAPAPPPVERTPSEAERYRRAREKWLEAWGSPNFLRKSGR